MYSFLLVILLRVELPCQRIQAYVILVGTTKQFYKAIVPTYTPIISV